MVLGYCNISDFFGLLKTIISHIHGHRKAATVAFVLVALSGAAFAAYNVVSQSIKRDGREKRVNVILKVPYGSVGLYSGTQQGEVVKVEAQNSDPNDNPSMHLRYYYNPVGAYGLLKVTIGSDEGMLDRPREYANGTPANFGYSLASFGTVHTDGGSYTRPMSQNLPTPSPNAPPTPADNDFSRIFLTRDIPVALHAELGFGESMLDLTGLLLTNTFIQTSASRTRVVLRSPNTIPMENCVINAGLGECVVDGICNFNCRTFDFSGGLGYYELHFTGNLQKNLEAKVEVGCGKVVINIPPNSARVQVTYDDNLFSSFAFQGLTKRRDGYYTSVGFDQSHAPILTLHLSTGVGKMVVNYR